MSSAAAAWPRWASSRRPPPSWAPPSARATAAAATARSRRTRRRAASRQAPAPKPTELPLGGRQIFPRFRVVAYYGAPQAHALGALGIGSPDHAVRRLAQQAKPYAKKTRPVMLALELLADVANRDPGTDGLYRTRQPASIIRRYLAAARRAKALLVLDIQPGHADFLAETRHLDRWLREPDVGLALDPEWHTPGAVPGTQIGSVEGRGRQRRRAPRRRPSCAGTTCPRSSSSCTSSRRT